jgi:putative tryptophan/tyrosine transport system substrate-binding protein
MQMQRGEVQGDDFGAAGRPVRPVGLLMPRGANDPESLARIAAFQRGLQQWGWTERHKVRIDTLWAGGSAEAIRKHSAELAALAPIAVANHD